MRPLKVFVLTVLLAVTAGLAMGCASLGSSSPAPQPARVVFKEVWGYLLRGDESDMSGVEPFTNICYFSADVAKDGRIKDAVQRPTVISSDGSRPEIYLVITELSNSALSHFSLSPDYGVRPLLISDICRISQDFDGVQIDFESVSPDDAGAFWDFLKELRAQLPPEKKLSVAVPARAGLKTDAYMYSQIAGIVDRIVVMAYDEHWGTSAPGPVASLPWCSAVLDYAQSTIESDKLIMGVPLYARAWQDKRLARAMGLQKVQSIIAEKSATPGYTSEVGPYFEYSENVVVKVYYDDLRSLGEKLQLYKSKDVSSVAFWRIGLGPSDLWSTVSSEKLASIPPDDQGRLGFPPDSQY
ncbi:MAG TPA: glycosyl hydrolase family 18 protein [Spirochaetia bacterium]|nr:glycosyl hydrolase family 18 protein [Spirochaetia bacterium]